ncbi:MAG: hypothetical protein WBG92_06020 [Thiohalocapsa sp.]
MFAGFELADVALQVAVFGDMKEVDVFDEAGSGKRAASLQAPLAIPDGLREVPTHGSASRKP